MNFKTRLRNKAFLLSMFGVIVAFVYQICGVIGFVPPIAQNDVTEFLGLAITLLSGLGVVVDPTTPGVLDNPKE